MWVRMKRLLATNIFLVIIITVCFTLTGCYDAREVDKLGYPIAIGLDKGKTNRLKLTLQFVVPKNIGTSGGQSNGGGSSENPLSVTSVETPSLLAGLNMINTYTSRQINLSHAKVLVISQELAKEGLHAYIHGAIRNKEFRPSMYIAVSAGSAEDYLNSIKPVFEVNPVNYYELTFSSYVYNAFIPKSTLNDFYHAQESHAINATTILVANNSFTNSKDININASTFKEKNRPSPLEGDFLTGSIPRTGEQPSEAMGTAVFNGDKMVGILDGEETALYLIAKGDYNYAYWTFPDPKHPEYYIALNIRQNRLPKVDVKMINNKPSINLKVDFDVDILSIQSDENYENQDNLLILQNYISNQLRDRLQKLLEKAAKQYKSDIFGFGKSTKTLFWTWREWDDFNWLDKFKDSQFNIQVKVELRRSGLMIRTIAPVFAK